MNSDITKLQTAISETKKVVSKEVGCTYRDELLASPNELFKLRTQFEKHSQHLDKKTVNAAKAKVKVLKTDLQAWGKVKQFYMKDSCSLIGVLTHRYAHASVCSRIGVLTL